MTEDDLTALFSQALIRALGSGKYNQFERRAFVRRMTRKLAAHFDTTGWPASKDEVLPYVTEAIDRYC